MSDDCGSRSPYLPLIISSVSLTAVAPLCFSRHSDRVRGEEFPDNGAPPRIGLTPVGRSVSQVAVAAFGQPMDGMGDRHRRREPGLLLPGASARDQWVGGRRESSVIRSWDGRGYESNGGRTCRWRSPIQNRRRYDENYTIQDKEVHAYCDDGAGSGDAVNRGLR